MIAGIGTDIVAVTRMADFWRRHGEHGLEKVLAADERDACRSSRAPERFLAKRFAAKEALGKALGTGIRAPLLMPNISVDHDDLGKPYFRLHGEAGGLLEQRGLVTHLSISDEHDFAVAFVIVEER